jgi:hypothetical protein
MSTTLGLVANVYNEIHALPGWLELHTPFFDDVRILHAGPCGEYSDDGTIELLEKWNIPIEYTSIDDGFGKVRTKAIRSSPCDWVMILDADERFYPVSRVLKCIGESTSFKEADAILQTYDFRDLKTMLPNWENVRRLGAKLNVMFEDTYDQGKLLRNLLTDDYDAICTVRRHWHDFTFHKPTQNWEVDQDPQLRTVRNIDRVYYSNQMHEQLIGAKSHYRPNIRVGPFFDHFHFSFKKLEIEQRAHDIAIYDAIHAGKQPPTKKEFNA